MREIIECTDPIKIQRYIEDSQGVSLKLRKVTPDECLKSGHPPHYDTGTGGHMPWCAYSASTLKTKDFKNGDFVFVDEFNKPMQTVSTAEHYGKTLVYDYRQKHMIKPHCDGDRVVDLYFWEIKE